MLYVFAISLGCPKNRVDTEQALGFSNQVRMVDNPAEADWIFLNTCGFIAPAVEESVQTIMEYVSFVEECPKNRRPKLIVAGCLVGRYGESTLSRELPEVDLFLDAKDVGSWRASLAALAGSEGGEGNSTTPNQSGFQPGYAGGAGGKGSAIRPKWSDTMGAPRVLSTPPSYAWLKISEGCRHSCAFCTIPSIRGRLLSASPERLVHEASFILEQGVKELILVAQDVTAWGKDRGQRLQDLLEKIFVLPGLERLRLMYLYPVGLDDELLSFLQQAGKPFVPYFDVPLQHASVNVLKRMGRPFAGDPRHTVDRIRRYFPEAALRTTFITGFPGETEKDFMELADFVGEVRFHHLGVFPYYPEEGTPAASMPDQIPEDIRNCRCDIIMKNQESISEEIMESYLGTIQEILVDAPHEEWPGLHTGRTWFQAPDIDGQVYVSGRDVRPGALIKAEITDTDIYDMSALSIQGA